ncbi:MAG: hypothetical protein ACJ72L_13050 [Marmoricola sp.]
MDTSLLEHACDGRVDFSRPDGARSCSSEYDNDGGIVLRVDLIGG